jgi:hypothetical protein
MYRPNMNRWISNPAKNERVFFTTSFNQAIKEYDNVLVSKRPQIRVTVLVYKEGEEEDLPFTTVFQYTEEEIQRYQKKGWLRRVLTPNLGLNSSTRNLKKYKKIFKNTATYVVIQDL